MKRRYRILIGFALLLVGSTITMCSITKSNIKKAYQETLEDPLDVIIVPGVPYEGESWHQVMKLRVYWSLHLFESGMTRNIIYSGSAVYSPYIEAEVMRSYSIQLGIPPEHTFSESKAEHSVENVYYGYKMAQELGFKKIGLATDPFQSKMVKTFTRKHVSKDIKFVPTDFDLMREYMDRPDPVINGDSLKVNDFVSIKERESWWTRFQGTMGRKVKQEIKGK